MSEEQIAVYAETIKAHQAIQQQQQDFYKEMQLQEAQRQQAAVLAGETILECRFVDDYRPLQFCRHLKAKGHCSRGSECLFAHNIEELHPISPDAANPDKDLKHTQ